MASAAALAIAIAEGEAAAEVTVQPSPAPPVVAVVAESGEVGTPSASTTAPAPVAPVVVDSPAAPVDTGLVPAVPAAAAPADVSTLAAAPVVSAEQTAAITPLSTVAASGQGGVLSPVSGPTSPAATVRAAPAVIRRHHAKGDPLEGFNRVMFAIHQFLDKLLFRPAAFAYKAIVPKPLRRGISHIFSNLEEPVVFVNDVLQLRPKRAVETMTRFIINSSVGVGGILDIAKTVDLPHRTNGFGNTLARYGVPTGPYLFIPFFGPGNFRDSPGDQVDVLVLQLGVGFPFRSLAYTVPSTVLPGLDLRASADADLKALLEGSADPYASLRSAYLQNRAAEVAELKGKSPDLMLDDPLVDPEAPGGTPPDRSVPDGAATTDPASPSTVAPTATPADTPADPGELPPDPEATDGAIDPITTPPPVVAPRQSETAISLLSVEALRTFVLQPA